MNYVMVYEKNDDVHQIKRNNCFMPAIIGVKKMYKILLTDCLMESFLTAAINCVIIIRLLNIEHWLT